MESLFADGFLPPAREHLGKLPLLGGPRPEAVAWRNWDKPIFHVKTWAGSGRVVWFNGSRGLMPSGVQIFLSSQNELSAAFGGSCSPEQQTSSLGLPSGPPFLSLPHSPRPTDSFLFISPPRSSPTALAQPRPLHRPLIHYHLQLCPISSLQPK